MKFIKRTNILVKTKRRFVVGSVENDELVQCPQCVEPMISAHASANLFGVSSREIYRLVEAGAIHFVETENNQMFVCPTLIRQVLEPIERAAPRLLDGKQQQPKINFN